MFTTDNCVVDIFNANATDNAIIDVLLEGLGGRCPESYSYLNGIDGMSFNREGILEN